MLRPDQAKLLRDLVCRGLKFDAKGNVVGVPAGEPNGDGDVAAVADALAQLEAACDGDDLRGRLVKFLTMLRQYSETHLYAQATELLRELGIDVEPDPMVCLVKRRDVALNLGGEYWVPRPVVDALFRIGAALPNGLRDMSEVWSLAALTRGVDRVVAAAKYDADIVGELAKLLVALDVPEQVAPSVHVVQEATRQAIERKAGDAFWAKAAEALGVPDDLDRAKLGQLILERLADGKAWN
jgi:hypothetical protein